MLGQAAATPSLTPDHSNVHRVCNPPPHADPAADFLWRFNSYWVIYIIALCMRAFLTTKWYNDTPPALYTALCLNQTLSFYGVFYLEWLYRQHTMSLFKSSLNPHGDGDSVLQAQS